MRCTVCRNGETEPGTTTVTLERDGAVVVIRGVPAEVCENCGEAFTSAETTEKTASPVLVVSRTQEWPGVWPCEGSKRRWSSILQVSSTSIALPAPMIGATLSAKQPEASRPSSCSRFQSPAT